MRKNRIRITIFCTFFVFVTTVPHSFRLRYAWRINAICSFACGCFCARCIRRQTRLRRGRGRDSSRRKTIVPPNGLRRFLTGCRVFFFGAYAAVSLDTGCRAPFRVRAGQSGKTPRFCFCGGCRRSFSPVVRRFNGCGVVCGIYKGQVLW